jgi:hypothetical protein
VTANDVAVLFISYESSSVSITGVTDSNGNDWDVHAYVGGNGCAAIATAHISSSLISGVDTVSVNLSSSTRTIVRGSSYEGLRQEWVSETGKSTTGIDYFVTWDSGGEGWAFVVFEFPNDYLFADDDISGWTQVFVTDDLTGLHSQQVFRKEVSDGTVLCQNDAISLPYVVAAIVLPFTAAGGYGQAVMVS